MSNYSSNSPHSVLSTSTRNSGGSAVKSVVIFVSENKTTRFNDFQLAQRSIAYAADISNIDDDLGFYFTYLFVGLYVSWIFPSVIQAYEKIGQVYFEIQEMINLLLYLYFFQTFY